MAQTQKRTPAYMPSLLFPLQTTLHEDYSEMLTQALMRDGKKTQAEKLFNGVSVQVSNNIQQPFHNVLLKVCQRVTPFFGIRSIRMGGSTLQVPFLLHPRTAYAQGIRWLLEGARRRQGKLQTIHGFNKPTNRDLQTLVSVFAPQGASALQSVGASTKSFKGKRSLTAGFAACLAAEIEDAFQGQGYANTQRRERHKRALANRQYAHYARW